MKINHAYILVARCGTRQGRSSFRDTERAVCTECPTVLEPLVEDGQIVRKDGQVVQAERAPDWVPACEALKHKRKLVAHVTTVEVAPEEAERARQTYAKVYALFRGVGFAVGSNVYLVARSNRALLDARLADAHKLVAKANAGFKSDAISVSFRPLVAEVDPAADEASTLESIRAEAEDAVTRVLSALEAGNADKLLDAAKHAGALAPLLDAEGAAQVQAVQSFAQKTVKALRRAAAEGERQLDKARAEAASGALRFAEIARRIAARTPKPDAAPAQEHNAA